MARIGRGFPSRPLVSSRGRPTHASTSLGTFATSWAFPAVTVTSPSVTINIGVFSTSWAWPTPQIAYDTTIAIGTFATTWAWPALTVDVPIRPGLTITRDSEIEWMGVLWSPLNQYVPQNDLEGWTDLPGISSGNAERTQRHGSWPGRDFAEARIVTTTIQLTDDSPTWLTSLRTIRALLTPGEDETEYPLVIRIRGETLLAYGKVKDRIIPPQLIGIGKANIVIQWICSDPRLLSLTETGLHITSTTTATNAGDVPTSPRLRFHGPVSIPRLLANDRVLAFQIELADGQSLTVDTNTGDTTVTAGGSVISDYVPLHVFSVPIEDFTLPPGSTEITYEPDSGGANGVDVFWRSAWM